MIKPGANMKEVAMIENMADEGMTAKKISAELKIEFECVDSLVKAHKASKKKKGD